MIHKEHSKSKIPQPSRREVLTAAAGAAATATMVGIGSKPVRAAEAEKVVAKGRINQSVCKWCFGKEPLDTFAPYCAQIGIKSIELVGPNQWGVLKKHGLTCAMTPSHGISKGLNRTGNHEMCIAKIRKSIDDTADAGFPNVICFSGNRAGMDDEEGLENCAIGLKQIVGYVEKKKITLAMELLNSKRNHKDYMCDRTHWGVKLVKKVGSPNFKLLYDIYHMQVQEGDVIATIKESKDYIGHYHTAGVPGRHEFDETQELYYPAIMKAIADTGFTGYVGQEFIPRKKDKLKSLAQAVQMCDV